MQWARDQATRQTAHASRLNHQSGHRPGRRARSALGRLFGFVLGLVVTLIMFGIFALFVAEVMKRSR
jgi:cytochrome c biogenesis protein CcdA